MPARRAKWRTKKERGRFPALSMIIGIFFLHSIFDRLQYICVYALPGLGGGLPYLLPIIF